MRIAITVGPSVARAAVNAFLISSAVFAAAPVQPKALAVPSDDGLGFHDAQGGAPIEPDSREPDPNESVARSQSQTTVLAQALQQEKLMTECKVLSVQSGPSLQAATKG